MPQREKPKVTVTRPFEEHGFYQSGETDDQLMGNCPLCDEDDHFFVHKETGQWDCKKCGREGNVFTFLTERMAVLRERMGEEPYKELAKYRGIPSKAFKLAEVAYDGSDWLIPAKSPAGYVNDIRKWNPKMGMRATAGCKLQLWNGEKLAGSKKGCDVYVCEGEWDGIALDWLLGVVGVKNYVVVAVPGANIFKDNWPVMFTGRNVILLYDHDEPGYSGLEKAYTKLKPSAASIQFINWSETLAEGYDVRDFIKDNLKVGMLPKTIWNTFKPLIKPAPKRPIKGFTPSANGVLKPEEEHAKSAADDAVGPAPSFGEVLEKFKGYVHMERDLELALKVILAVCLTERLPGDPLWMYIVSPPGGGKTLLLSATQKSQHVVYRSTVTPHGLVSGFRIEPDPSLLAQVHNKVLIFKDGTELLAMPQAIQDEVFNIFRGAYDGHVEKSYGNGVVRLYSPLHFTMLIGVTPVIDAHSKALLGERFMKFRIRYKDQRAVILAAMNNVAREPEIEDNVHRTVVRFLNRDVDPRKAPTIPTDIFHRIAALAELTAMLRAVVEKDKFTNEMYYRPEFEVASRLSKQLVKMGMGLAMTESRQEVSEEDYEILYRIACDTGIGYHMDIVHAMAARREGIETPVLCEVTEIPNTTLHRRLESLLALGIIYRKRDTDHTAGKNGVKPFRYFLSDRVLELWDHVAPPRIKPKPREPIRVHKRFIVKRVVR